MPDKTLSRSTKVSKRRTKNTIPKNETESGLTAHEQNMPTLNSPFPKQATPAATPGTSTQKASKAERKTPAAHNRPSSLGSVPTPQPVLDPTMPQAHTQFGQRPDPAAENVNLAAAHLETGTTAIQAYSSQMQRMHQYMQRNHGQQIPKLDIDIPYPDAMNPALQDQYSPFSDFRPLPQPFPGPRPPGSDELQPLLNHTYLPLPQPLPLPSSLAKNLQNVNTFTPPPSHIFNILHPDATCFDPSCLIHINGHAISRREATFLAALHRYLDLDDDACSEILRFGRENFDPVDLSNFYEQIMDSPQTREGVENALRSKEPIWRRECKRVFNLWLRCTEQL